MARLGRARPNRPLVAGPHASGPPHGDLVLDGQPSLTLTGTPGHSGDLVLDGQPSLTLTGTKRIEGIGAPPRPRNPWQLIAGPASGGHEAALTKALGRKFTFKLTEPSEVTFSYKGVHPEAAQIGELTTDVHVLWSPGSGPTRILDRLRVGPTQDALEPSSARTSFNCFDYRGMLNLRRLYSGDTLSYTGEDIADIAWKLIETTQGRAAGHMGISKGVADDFTGVTRDVAYEAGDSIGQRIGELAEAIGGFDWDIVPTGPASLKYDVWYPQRGSDNGVVLIWGGRMIAKVQRTVDITGYANAIRYTGSIEGDPPATTAVELEAGYLGYPGAFPEGRVDAVYGDDGLRTQGQLEARAAWQLDQSQVIRPVYVVTLSRGAWEGPDHIWLGDPVRLIIKHGRLNVDASYRVYEVEVTLTESGRETVVLTLGGPRPRYSRRTADYEKRLTDLERR